MQELNRRDVTRAAMLGGASFLLGQSASAQSPAGHAGLSYAGLLDARAFGAAGDGKTDDTAALQKALEAAGASGGGVFLPPGTYLTRELHLRAGSAMVGIPAWNYSSGGGSVLKLTGTDSTCLLNLTEARGGTVTGLSLDGAGLGKGIHGVATQRGKWGPHEDGFRIEDCQVAHFTGDGVHLECAWCFSVRHCQIGHNRGDGLSLRGWDGFILDNWFSGNGGAGYAARQENASVTFTANRVEWNAQENFVIVGGDGYQITGNFFDRAGTVGVAVRRPQGRSGASQISITGNLIKRSGKNADPDSLDSAQVLLDGASGVVFTGNTLWSGRDDGPTGLWSPGHGIVYRALENCVLGGNVLHDGALKELLTDLGGHAGGVQLYSNPGRLFVPKT